MYRYAFLFLGLAMFGMLGCGPAAPPAPTISVRGTVKLGGVPIPSGEIVFSVPSEAEKPPSTLAITNGSYDGLAHAGMNRVEVYVFKDGPPASTDPDGPPVKVNIISSKYHGTETTLSADVKSGDANTFPFDVTSK